MTNEEFHSLTVGGLQRLHKVLFNGALSLSRNKPALRSKLSVKPWGDVAFSDIVPPTEPARAADGTADGEVASAPKTAKRKDKAKPKKKEPAKAKPKAEAKKPAGDEESRAVSLIKKLHGEGKSLREIKATLEKKGVHTARGGKTWWPSSIQSALGQRW